MPQGVGLTPHLFVTEASAGRITQLLSTPLAPPLSNGAYGRVFKNRENCPRNRKSEKLGLMSTSCAKELRLDALSCDVMAGFCWLFFPPFSSSFCPSLP